jgi:prevent-host-death family protein
MVTKVDLHDAESRLGAYLERASRGGERILVARSGQPLAALVSVEDLDRLENGDATPGAGDHDENRRLRFRRSMKDAGLVLQWPTGTPLPKDAYKPLKVGGAPVSADIIADRR